MRSAGSLVWRFTDPERCAEPGDKIDPRDIEVLIVHRPRYKDWSWPKGKTEAHEPIISAAVREVEEETGLPVVLGAPLTTQRYRLGSGQIKEVRYWVGTLMPTDPSEAGAAAERTRVPVHLAPASEIDESRWVSPDKAEDMLTRRGDRRLLGELTSRASQGRLVTSTLIIARHAKATSRSSWPLDEQSRPLTRTGVRQALALVESLSAYGVQNAYASPWARCRQTVAPWAGVGGVPVWSVPEITEDAVELNPQEATDFLTDMVHAPHAPSIIVGHRPTLPTLFAPILAVTPANLHSAFPSASPWLSTAEMLVVHISHEDEDAQVIGVERHLTRLR